MNSRILPTPAIPKVENQRLKNKRINKMFYHHLNIFENIIMQNPNFSLDIYNYNINDAKVHLDHSSKKILGSYESGNKTIALKKKNAIYHELFHLLSTYDTEYITYSGFSQQHWAKNYYLGTGLNEGYTQILAKRYFEDYMHFYTYIYEGAIVLFLEDIIGRDLMEKLYSEANLYELINILKEYSSEKEVYKFLKNVDLINSFYHQYGQIIIFNSAFKTIYKNIFTFLYQIFCQVTELDFLDGYISGQEMEEELIYFQNKIHEFLDMISLNLNENKMYSRQRRKK